jgi:hypothetical protein
MFVDIRRLPNPDPTPQQRVSSGGKVRDPVIETASYGYPMKRKLVQLPTWRIVRRAVENQAAADPLPGWSYDLRPEGEGRDHLSPMIDLTKPLLARLPEDAVAFEVERRVLIVYWLEKPGTNVEMVGELAASLAAYEASLVALEDEILLQIDNNDS